MARQKEDTKTLDLLASPGTNRQRKFKAAQRAKGLEQVTFWLTEEQEIFIRSYLKNALPPSSL